MGYTQVCQEYILASKKCNLISDNTIHQKNIFHNYLPYEIALDAIFYPLILRPTVVLYFNKLGELVILKNFDVKTVIGKRDLARYYNQCYLTRNKHKFVLLNLLFARYRNLRLNMLFKKETQITTKNYYKSSDEENKICEWINKTNKSKQYGLQLNS